MTARNSYLSFPGRPPIWAEKGPGLVMVWAGVAVQGAERELTSSPRIGRYSKPTWSDELSPISSTSPRSISCWPEESATDPVVCTCGGVNAGSALVIFSTAGFGQRKLSCSRWVCTTRTCRPSFSWCQLDLGLISGWYSTTWSFWPSTLTSVLAVARTECRVNSFQVARGQGVSDSTIA